MGRKPYWPEMPRGYQLVGRYSLCRSGRSISRLNALYARAERGACKTAQRDDRRSFLNRRRRCPGQANFSTLTAPVSWRWLDHQARKRRCFSITRKALGSRNEAISFDRYTLSAMGMRIFCQTLFGHDTKPKTEMGSKAMFLRLKNTLNGLGKGFIVKITGSIDLRYIYAHIGLAFATQ